MQTDPLQPPPPTPGRTVREATFDVFRRRGLTTIFANPGSTEVPFLTDLPGDFTFVLALHESSVVGLATGHALGRGAPSLALLHTTAGLGNGVSAIATARVNRAPVVVLVGQQDRRHLAYEPFLTGRLAGLAGDYPVRVEQPVRAQDVPAAVERAFHAAAVARGPALVIVPMNDWEAPADDEREPAAAIGEIARAVAVAPEVADALAAFLDGAKSPALVVGAGADDAPSRAAVVALAERLGAPVYQEAFGARAGFPHDHPLFAGLLPAGRPGLRERLAPYDTLLVIGGPAFRQSFYAPGRLTMPGTRIAIVTEDPRRRTAARPSSPCWHRLPPSAPPSSRGSRGGSRRGPSRSVPRPFRRRRRRASRCVRATCSLRSPSDCPRTRSCSRRRPSTGPSCRSG